MSVALPPALQLDEDTIALFSPEQRARFFAARTAFLAKATRLPLKGMQEAKAKQQTKTAPLISSKKRERPVEIDIDDQQEPLDEQEQSDHNSASVTPPSSPKAPKGAERKAPKGKNSANSKAGGTVNGRQKSVNDALADILNAAARAVQAMVDSSNAEGTGPADAGRIPAELIALNETILNRPYEDVQAKLARHFANVAKLFDHSNAKAAVQKVRGHSLRPAPFDPLFRFASSTLIANADGNARRLLLLPKRPTRTSRIMARAPRKLARRREGAAVLPRSSLLLLLLSGSWTKHQKTPSETPRDNLVQWTKVTKMFLSLIPLGRKNRTSMLLMMTIRLGGPLRIRKGKKMGGLVSVLANQCGPIPIPNLAKLILSILLLERNPTLMAKSSRPSLESPLRGSSMAGAILWSAPKGVKGSTMQWWAERALLLHINSPLTGHVHKQAPVPALSKRRMLRTNTKMRMKTKSHSLSLLPRREPSQTQMKTKKKMSGNYKKTSEKTNL